MEKQYKFNFLDLLVLIVKHKVTILIICLVTLITSYLFLRFAVDEKFDSSALIIPAEDQTLGGLGGMLKGLKDLPFGMGTGSVGESIGMYNTIIGSRSSMEEIVRKFNLISVYEIDSTEKGYLEEAIKSLSKNIKTNETDDDAYEITVRDKDPKRAAAITNHIIDLLNRRIIELKTQKSKNNRVFLEERLAEVKLNLKNAEDSMKIFQEQSGMLNAESQIKGIFEVYTSLEAELITKQVQLSIFEKLYDKESPILNRARTELQEYEAKIKEIKSKGQPQSILLSKGSIPAKTIAYLRHYRNVEINSAILEFVLPLHEQAKFEEQKDIPILQVVDYAVPAQKKSYPPRTLFALMITVFVFFTSCLFIFIKSVISNTSNEKLKYVISNLLSYRDKREL